MENEKKVTLYGAGLIGCGWATCLIMSNYPSITIYDIGEAQLKTARQMIRSNLEFFRDEDLISDEDIDFRLANVIFTTSQTDALENAWLIQENCPEDIELKQNIMVEIEKYCSKDTLIASSTSGMPVSSIGAKMKHPERLFGAHPYHPVHLLPLVELVKDANANEEALKELKDFYISIGKEPVVLKKECPGYIGSRLMFVLMRESTYMINEGYTTMEDIDRAFTYGPGLRYGIQGIYMTLQLAGGENGIAGTLFGGIGTSGGNWMDSVANFTEWPDNYISFWRSCQKQMDEIISKRDDIHGRTTEEITSFRDRGLVELLKHHGKFVNSEKTIK